MVLTLVSEMRLESSWAIAAYVGPSWSCHDIARRTLTPIPPQVLQRAITEYHRGGRLGMGVSHPNAEGGDKTKQSKGRIAPGCKPVGGIQPKAKRKYTRHCKVRAATAPSYLKPSCPRMLQSGWLTSPARRERTSSTTFRLRPVLQSSVHLFPTSRVTAL